MASSGCPRLNWFKPLVRYHLPFSTIEETMFRILSKSLISQFLKAGDEKTTPVSLIDIKEVYSQVEFVNLDFIKRIQSYAKGDADANAIAALDLFAKLFDFEVEANFESLQPFVNEMSNK